MVIMPDIAVLVQIPDFRGRNPATESAANCYSRPEKWEGAEALSHLLPGSFELLGAVDGCLQQRLGELRVVKALAPVFLDELDLLFWSEETGHVFK